jgi:hypothetical protein
VQDRSSPGPDRGATLETGRQGNRVKREPVVAPWLSGIDEIHTFSNGNNFRLTETGL